MQPSHHQARTFRFIELDTGFDELGSGCRVPVSHVTNQDGYLRIGWTDADGRKRQDMFHRLIYCAANEIAEIPDGFEIDHACGTRCCANRDHLHLIAATDHTSNTNRERYSHRIAAARLHWQRTGCTGTSLGELFGVSPSCGCRWIREWKAESQAA